MPVFASSCSTMLANGKHSLVCHFSESAKRILLSRRCHATLIDGKLLAKKIFDNLSIEAAAFENKYRRKALLSCILIGNKWDSLLYVKNKVKAAEKVGINTKVLMLPSNISERDLLAHIYELNESDEVDGILLQLPLPNYLKMDVCNEICPRKDVDGFTSTNLGKLFLNMNAFIPCTALAVHRVLEEIGADMKGKNAVICGRSKHVSLPIAMLLHSNFERYGFNTTTTICHRYTPAVELTRLCLQADIIISAAGIPSLIRGEMVKKGAIVVDVGITRIDNYETNKTRIVGDVNFDEVVQVASYITPVPGGIGPLTIAMLMHNTIKAAQQRMLVR